MLSELPADALSLITSYCIGEPWQIKIKHNNLLKAIQTKYKYKIAHKDFYENVRQYPEKYPDEGGGTESEISYYICSKMLNTSMIERELYRIEHFMKYMEQYHENTNSLIYWIKINVSYMIKFYTQYIESKSDGLRLHQKRRAISSELNLLIQNINREMNRFGNTEVKLTRIKITVKAGSCEY